MERFSDINDDEEFDEHGWAPVHHAAHRGQSKVLSEMIKRDASMLDLRTRDGRQSSPLLIACNAGKVRAVEKLIKLEADVSQYDANHNGPIDIAIWNENFDLVKSFIEMSKEHLAINPWKVMLQWLDVDTPVDASAIRYITSVAGMLLELANDTRYDEDFARNDVLRRITNFLTNTRQDTGDLIQPREETGKHIKDIHEKMLDIVVIVVARHSANITKNEQVGRNLMSYLPYSTVATAGRILYIFSEVIAGVEFINLMNSNNGFYQLVHLLNSKTEEEIVALILKFLLKAIASHPSLQNILEETTELLPRLVDIMEQTNSSDEMTCLALQVIIQLMRGNPTNQEIFSATGCMEPVVHLLKQRAAAPYHAICADLVRVLASGNAKIQANFVQTNIASILTKRLLASKDEQMKISMAGALWAIAEDNSERKFHVAKQLAINGLLQLVYASNPELVQYVGSELLSCFVHLTTTHSDQINAGCGIELMLKLLTLPTVTSRLKLSALRNIRHLCVGIGTRPNQDNQNILYREGYLKTLADVYQASSNELEVAESSCTLCAAMMENKTNYTSIMSYKPFVVSDIIELLNSTDEHVQLIAGLGISMLLFRNEKLAALLKLKISISYTHFQKYIIGQRTSQSSSAAYQLVVLKNFISGQPPSSSAAAGITVLVDNLYAPAQEVRAQSAGFIAGLARMKSGVPEAILSVGSIQFLCKILSEKNDAVISAAAHALSTLSEYSDGRKRLLAECRQNPSIVRTIQQYAYHVPLSKNFLARWKHVHDLRVTRRSAPTEPTRFMPRLLQNKTESHIRAALSATGADDERFSQSFHLQSSEDFRELHEQMQALMA